MSLLCKDGSSLLAAVRPLLGWSEVDASKYADRLARLDWILGTLDDDLFPGAIIPRVVSRELHYYAVAAHYSQRQRLASLLRASVGPTISDFSGQVSPFIAWDDLEAVLIDNGYDSGFRFSAGSDGKRGQYASKSLERLRHLVREAGAVPSNQPRTTAQELRRFELCLTAYDRTGAEESIQFLRSNMRLHAINLGAMAVRLHSRFQEWEQICSLDNFQSLCGARRAAKVTDLLAEAVYRTHILGIEDEVESPRLIQAFEEKVAPIAGILFSSCPEYVSPLAGRAFLLSAAASDPPNEPLVEQLCAISEAWEEEDKSIFDVLTRSIFGQAPDPMLGIVWPETNYHRQIALLLEDSQYTLERGHAGLIAATQVNTISAFQAVVAYVEGLQQSDRDQLLSNQFNLRAYDTMVEQSRGMFSPENWIEWIGALDRGDLQVPSDMALSLPDKWKVSEHLRDEGRVSALVEAIEDASSTAEDQLLDVLPHLVRWLQTDPQWPNPSLTPIYRAIYNLILLHLVLRWQREAAVVAKEMLRAILELGVDEDEYVRQLNDMRDALPAAAGRGDADLLLDLAEIVVDNSSPDPDARLALWVKIADSLKALESLLDVEEKALVNDMGQVFDIDEFFSTKPESSEVAPESSALGGKVVAIYSLRESVAQRVGRLLEKLYPGIRVELSADTVGSQRLEDLARRAHIFVVCWRSATHAATEYIKRHRPSGLPLIYPEGNGSSSILRKLRETYSS